MEVKNQTEELHWFVLKTIFSREMRVKRLLDERAIESFIPMQYKIKTKFGKKEKVLIPVIKDLIFVHAEKKRVEEFKKELFLREGFEAYFLTRKEGYKRIIEIIPDKQMEDFINVASHLNDDITYFNSEDIELKKGTKVRVIGGIFDGIEGTLLKVKGKRSKRIVIEIPGVAIAASYIEPDLIEVLN